MLYTFDEAKKLVTENTRLKMRNTKWEDDRYLYYSNKNNEDGIRMHTSYGNDVKWSSHNSVSSGKNWEVK